MNVFFSSFVKGDEVGDVGNVVFFEVGKVYVEVD